MGRQKKYGKKSFAEAVERYFQSITRRVTVKERVPTGQKDKYGHDIFEERPVKNSLGETVEITEYLVIPSVGSICEFLGIHRSTWAEYADAHDHPEYSDTIAYARGRMRDWRENELLTRKDVKGIIFDLENNYGYREKKDINVGGSLEELLGKAAEDGEGAQVF